MTTAGPLRPTPVGGHRTTETSATTTRASDRRRDALRPAPLTLSPAHAPQDAPPEVIRRLVPRRGHAEHLASADTFHEADHNTLVKAVDDATQKAYAQILTRPLFTGLEALVATSGHLSLWVEKARAEADGTAPAGAASARLFGYAVETLTTHLLGGSREGWTLAYQVTAGATRPDVVATKDGRVMWLDLTAAPSAGHIYTLKAWDSAKVCPYPHAEITYPELAAGTRAVLVANAREEIAGRPKAAAVDADALKAQVAAAQKQHAANLERWRAKYCAAVRQAVRDAPRADKAVQDLARRNTVYDWLDRTFSGATFYRERAPRPSGPIRKARHLSTSRSPYDRPDDSGESTKTESPSATPEQARLAASILMALGLEPTTYGFLSSASTAQGVAFLEEHDPPTTT